MMFRTLLLTALLAPFFSQGAFAYTCRGADAQARAQLARIYNEGSREFGIVDDNWYQFRKMYSPKTGILQINNEKGFFGGSTCHTNQVNEVKVDIFCYPWSYGRPSYVYITNGEGRNAFIANGPISNYYTRSIGLICRK